MRNATDQSGFGIWNPTHLYIDDGGVCYCGAHMGVESTYIPHAWSDLGDTELVIHEGIEIRCEDPRCKTTPQEGGLSHDRKRSR